MLKLTSLVNYDGSEVLVDLTSIIAVRKGSGEFQTGFIINTILSLINGHTIELQNDLNTIKELLQGETNG